MPSTMTEQRVVTGTRPTLDRPCRGAPGHVVLCLVDFKILESVLREGPVNSSRLGTEIGLAGGYITTHESVGRKHG